MSAPVDELRLGERDSLPMIVRRINEWARAVTSRLREPATERVQLTFDPSDLPIDIVLQSKQPPRGVYLLAASTLVDPRPVYSGGYLTWSAEQGRLRLCEVNFSGGQTYEALFEVRF